MKTVKLLLLLLLPAALFFASCQNELPPETFLIELNPATADDEDRYKVSDVDYFVLRLYKLNPAKKGLEAEGPDDRLPYDIRLERGDILRLEGLEPGYYKILGDAYKINKDFDAENFDPENSPEEDGPYFQVGFVLGKSDRMYKYLGSDYIIVETGVPVIVRLIFTGANDNI